LLWVLDLLSDYYPSTNVVSFAGTVWMLSLATTITGLVSKEIDALFNQYHGLMLQYHKDFPKKRLDMEEHVANLFGLPRGRYTIVDMESQAA
jgi:hypothetical protein